MLLLGIILCFILSLSVYLFFKGFTFSPFNAFQGDSYITEIMAAFMGTVFTIIVTAVLLKTQSVMEENKEKSLGIFQAKLELYSSFIDFLNDIIEDNTIDVQELKQLEKWILKLSLVANDEITFTLVEFVDQTIKIRKLLIEELSYEDKIKFVTMLNEKNNIQIDIKNIDKYFITVGTIIGLLRKDLGEEVITDKETLKATWDCVDKLLIYSKRQRNLL